jgi:hypothetical protein
VTDRLRHTFTVDDCRRGGRKGGKAPRVTGHRRTPEYRAGYSAGHRIGRRERQEILSTLGTRAVAYMAECMAMPDAMTDQEQNWIAGHLHTFAHRVLTEKV